MVAKQSLISCGLLLLLATHANGQMLLEARPTVRINASEEGATRETLSKLDQEKSKITSAWRDGKYLWTSREGVELVLQGRTGPTYFFVEPRGAGYVKVFDTHVWPDSMRDPGPRYRFMEHVHIGLGTITYWGSCDELGFRPWVGR
ncbi:MAG TPA: hypothetical protein VFQ05_16920 [Candidatus Eisenbacteria bacterium]|nr:hypothetical protein [Candidatus Eisenbacteria bacterium]